jgi:hypothetical protein
VVHIELLNFLHRHHPDPHPQGLASNPLGQPFSTFRANLLGIVNPRDYGLGREHDGGCYHRPGQRPHSNFINSRDVADSGAPKPSLQPQHRAAAPPISLICFLPSFQLPVNLPNPFSLIPLQLAEQAGGKRARTPE